MKKANSLISYKNNERTNFFSTPARSKKFFWFRIYMPWETQTMSFVWFEQLLDALIWLCWKKSLFRFFLIISNEIFNLFPGKLQLKKFYFDIYIHGGTRKPILVGFEQLLDVLNKLYVKKVNSFISNENNERRNFFLRKLNRKFFLILNLNALRNSIYEFRLIWTTY